MVKGYIYLWRDSKRNWFYIGSHEGDIDDGYICSNKRMLAAYKKRPQDFRRRILESGEYDSREGLFERENHWLSFIDDHELQLAQNKKNDTIRYYNVKKQGLGVDSKTASFLKQQYWNSPEGELLKKKMSKAMKGNTLGKNRIPWNKNISLSEEHRQNISNGLIGKKRGPMSEETKQKVSDSKKGIPLSDEHKQKIANGRRGMKQTDYQKQRAREANTGKIVSEETKTLLADAARKRSAQPHTCPHCNHIGYVPNIYRWHFDNCVYINS